MPVPSLLALQQGSLRSCSTGLARWSIVLARDGPDLSSGALMVAMARAEKAEVSVYMSVRLDR